MVVLITGANRGIGYAITQEMLSQGYKVIALSKSVENLLKIQNDNLIVYEINLLDIIQIDKVLRDLQSKKLCVNALINNAGMGIFKTVDQLDLSEWEDLLRLNLTVPYYLIHKLVNNSEIGELTKIINIGSDADSIPFENAGAYCASKYGLRGLTESLRIELKKKNIGVSLISPSRVDTYFNGKYPGCRPISLKAEHIAKQVTFILSQDNVCNIEQIKLSSILE